MMVPGARKRKLHFVYQLIWIGDVLTVYFVVVTPGF